MINKSSTTLDTQNIQIVQVKFENCDKPYTFKTTLDLKIDDLVVVDTSYGFQTATVIKTKCDPHIHYKWVIDKINLDNFNNIKDYEASLENKINNEENEHKLPIFVK